MTARIVQDDPNPPAGELDTENDMALQEEPHVPHVSIQLSAMFRFSLVMYSAGLNFARVELIRQMLIPSFFYQRGKLL